MTVATTALAALTLIPQPHKVIEGEGVTTNLEIRAGDGAQFAPGGHRIRVTGDGIVVYSSDPTGRYYAERTLDQLYNRDEKGRPVSCPCVEIEDGPRYAWRGLHFDDCRHFFGKVQVKKTLDLMARYKMNRFHWHLTDDQGWRIEIPSHPELVRYGAVRSQSVLPGVRASSGKVQNAEKLDGVAYGPYFYTEADVKEIIAYAAERHIVIVPEIEAPGHVQAVLAAHPEFACEPANVADRDPRVVWGIAKDVLCVGNDAAVAYMEDVIDYVCRLFPGEVVHIGGDECPVVRWKTCPKCQARMKAEGLKDERAIQPWFTRRLVSFLASRGKRAIGWDEYLAGDVPVSAMGMCWRVSSHDKGRRFVTPAEHAAKGHDLVMSPVSHCYLDSAQELKEDPFFYIGGHLPLEKCHSFDPCAGIPAELRDRVLGGQGNNWSEYTWNRHDLEWKMWPRACALAEVLWTGEHRPDFADFRERMARERRWLIAHHVNCAPLE